MSERVPEGWKNTTIGDAIADIADGGTPSTTNPEYFGGDIPWVVIDDIQPRITQTKSTITDLGLRKSSAKLWDKGTIILSTGATIGEVGIAIKAMTTKQGICGIVPKDDVSADYFYHLLVSKKRQLNTLSQGSTIKETRPPTIKKIQINLPPLPEQKKIASILTSVDEVIENTQKQIYKLEDLKKATMNELLTKGIGHTEFRDSELGRIPKSWEILEIHKLFDDIKEFVSENSNLPLFSLTMVDGLVPKPDRYVRDFLITDKSKDNYKAVRKNELVMNPMNLRWGAIASHHADFDVCVSKYYNVISLRNVNLSSQFYEQLFQSKRFLNIYEKIAVGTLDEKKRVHWSDFKNIKVPVPPVDEQKIIGEVIDASAHNLKIKKKKLTLIQSLKKSLMQDLLTGKVRVKVN